MTCLGQTGCPVERCYRPNIEERTVDVHVRRLRKVLEPFNKADLIQTVRGVGYRFSSMAD